MSRFSASCPASQATTVSHHREAERPNVEKTGVFAGMSGSPVYIDGKIVGAIAFSFPFSKEPIGGITPIKQMIDLFNKGSENLKPKEPRVVSFSQLAGTDWKPNLPKPAVSSVSLLAPVSAGSPRCRSWVEQMAPIATPLVFTGISQESLSVFAPQLMANGLLPVSGAGGSAAITPLAKSTKTHFRREARSACNWFAVTIHSPQQARSRTA